MPRIILDRLENEDIFLDYINEDLWFETIKLRLHKASILLLEDYREYPNYKEFYSIIMNSFPSIDKSDLFINSRVSIIDKSEINENDYIEGNSRDYKGLQFFTKLSRLKGRLRKIVNDESCTTKTLKLEIGDKVILIKNCSIFFNKELSPSVVIWIINNYLIYLKLNYDYESRTQRTPGKLYIQK